MKGPFGAFLTGRLSKGSKGVLHNKSRDPAGFQRLIATIPGRFCARNNS